MGYRFTATNVALPPAMRCLSFSVRSVPRTTLVATWHCERGDGQQQESNQMALSRPRADCDTGGSAPMVFRLNESLGRPCSLSTTFPRNIRPSAKSTRKRNHGIALGRRCCCAISGYTAPTRPKDVKSNVPGPPTNESKSTCQRPVRFSCGVPTPLPSAPSSNVLDLCRVPVREYGQGMGVLRLVDWLEEQYPTISCSRITAAKPGRH